MGAHRGKPAPKADHVARDIRNSILTGQLRPGVRLPVRGELEVSFGVSWSTLQKAVDQLRLEGFVVTRGRNGTFVSDRPPHLHRYALVLPHRPGANDSRFLIALQQRVTAAAEAQGRRLSAYYYCDGDVRSQDHQALLRDVVGHRLAGLIFAFTPTEAIDSPILTQSGLPRVGMTSASNNLVQMPRVICDKPAFWRRALDHLKSRGRRRIGIVTMCPTEPSRWHPIQAAIDQTGIETRPYWTLFCAAWQMPANPVQGSQLVANPVNMMMRLPPDQRPDALVIGDENLVEQALAGVVASGVRVPQDLEIVIHCSFPNPAQTMLPVWRLGFDTRRWLSVCCDVIAQQRRGEAVPPEIWVEPLFEEELRNEMVQDRLWSDIRAPGAIMRPGITG